MNDPAKNIMRELQRIEDLDDDMHIDIILTAVDRETMAIRRRRRMTPAFGEQDAGHLLAGQALRAVHDLASVTCREEIKHAALMDVHQAVHAEIDSETDPDELCDRSVGRDR